MLRSVGYIKKITLFPVSDLRNYEPVDNGFRAYTLNHYNLSNSFFKIVLPAGFFIVFNQGGGPVFPPRREIVYLSIMLSVIKIEAIFSSKLICNKNCFNKKSPALTGLL